MGVSAGLVGAGRSPLVNSNMSNLKMNRTVLLFMAVLSLSACQAKQPKQVAAAPAPVATSEAAVPSPAPAPVVESVVARSVEAPVAEVAPAPVVVAIAPVAETKPAAVVTPQPVAAPKLITPSAIAKSAAPTVPAVPKVATPAVSDADGIALAKKRNCFACHLVDKKVVGPAWKDVAAKYRGDAAAQARMEAKIGKGGSGAWGSMAMPPQPQVTAEERSILARFILNLK